MAWFLCCIFFRIQSREKEFQTACHPSRERDYFTYCFYGLLWCFLWVCTFQQFNSAALKCRLVGILALKVVSIISILNFLSWSCHDCWFILTFYFILFFFSQSLLTSCLEDYWAAYDRSGYRFLKQSAAEDYRKKCPWPNTIHWN